MTDPIADMLARIRNALMARHDHVNVPYSSIKKRIAEILQAEGYVTRVDVIESKPFDFISIGLRYGEDRSSIIQGLKRESSPGSRMYVKADEIPQVREGLGTAIVSTSKGLMTDYAARQAKVGGEVLCTVW